MNTTIQLITADINKRDSKNIKVSNLAEPEALDMYDVTIVDLNNALIWKCTGNYTSHINKAQDLINLNSMIRQSNKTKFIYVLPQNCSFCYCYGASSRTYLNREELKNMLVSVMKILQGNLGFPSFELSFENNLTQIGSKKLKSSFHFSWHNGKSISTSEGSKKVTTISVDDKIYTTLNLSEYEDIIEFLRATRIIQDKEDVPSWMNEIEYFDDRIQQNNVKEYKQEMQSISDKIDEANSILEKNNKFKSILYTNSDELVSIVFDILEQILGYDLSNFEDMKKEDFLIKFDSITFIGEIKGITSNVKSANVSQLETHFQEYLDKLEEEKINETVKPILIINHQRNIPLESRQPINEQQEKLATRNGALIIETVILLELFDKFLKEEIDSVKIKNILSEKIGLLTVEDI